VEVRPVRPDEHEEAGALVVAAYRALPGEHLSDDYAALLADVHRRSAEAEVLVAPGAGAEGRQRVLGCVTFVPDSASPWSELIEDGESGIRMLAVHPDAQRQGIGRALVDACIARAAALDRLRVVLHTTPWMTAAHHLYEAVGFTRFPERDFAPVPEVPLLAYRLELGADGP
jgi:ribosomal protein S18 acetylase RimI-like enzyme